MLRADASQLAALELRRQETCPLHALTRRRPSLPSEYSLTCYVKSGTARPRFRRGMSQLTSDDVSLADLQVLADSTRRRSTFCPNATPRSFWSKRYSLSVCSGSTPSTRTALLIRGRDGATRARLHDAQRHGPGAQLVDAVFVVSIDRHR